jgi:hypothetical protein
MTFRLESGTRPGDRARRSARTIRTPFARRRHRAFTARLTIDDTPGQCGRIKVTTLQRGQIVADMLRELRARGFSYKRRLAMKAIAAAGKRSNDAATASTRVELDWLGKRIKHWIRFGRIVKKTVLNRRWRIFSFPPHPATKERAPIH